MNAEVEAAREVLLARLRAPIKRRDWLAGYVPCPDDTPELTEAASRAFVAWADE